MLLTQLMTVYKDSLPSMHLSAEDLKEIEKAFKKDSTNIDFDLIIEKNGFEYNLDSVDEFINDVGIPDTATEYKIKLRCNEGKLSIDSTFVRRGRIYISGNREWVHKKKRHLLEQINKNKKTLRTYSTKIISAGAVLFWIFFLAASFTSTGNDQTSITFYEGLIGAILTIGLGSWPFILVEGQSYVYPYHLIKRDESVSYRPRFHKAVKIGFGLLTALGTLSGIYSLFQILT